MRSQCGCLLLRCHTQTQMPISPSNLPIHHQEEEINRSVHHTPAVVQDKTIRFLYHQPKCSVQQICYDRLWYSREGGQKVTCRGLGDCAVGGIQYHLPFTVLKSHQISCHDINSRITTLNTTESELMSMLLKPEIFAVGLYPWLISCTWCKMLLL